MIDDANISPNSVLDHVQDLALRSQMSTVQPSSIVDIWKAASGGQKMVTCISFLKARFGTGKLSSGEFIRFGFCDGEKTQAEIEAHLGKQAQQAFHKLSNDRTWYAVTKNKLLFETVMRGAGLSCPQTIGFFDRKGRGFGPDILTNDSELRAFLLNPENYPMFAKPTTGLLSIGSFRIDGAEGENLLINGGEPIKVEDVIAYIRGLSPKGYVFQKVLNAHSSLVKLNGKAIASVRFVVLNIKGRVEVHACAMKLPASGSVADNFWRDGSILCDIDRNSGKIVRAVENNQEGLKEVTINPVSGEKLIDFELPDFEKSKTLVLQGAKLFPGIQTQSWDVAYCEDGPVLLEVNYGGDLNLIQIASGKGIYTGNYKSLIEGLR